MNRRAFIAGLGGVAAWPLTARAQQPAMPVIGILSGGSPETFAPLEAPFREGLAEVGFVEGKNLAFEYRWAQGHFERLPALAVDLVGRRPAVIATNTLPAAMAAKAATNIGSLCDRRGPNQGRSSDKPEPPKRQHNGCHQFHECVGRETVRIGR